MKTAGAEDPFAEAWGENPGFDLRRPVGDWAASQLRTMGSVPDSRAAIELNGKIIPLHNNQIDFKTGRKKGTLKAIVFEASNVAGDHKKEIAVGVGVITVGAVIAAVHKLHVIDKIRDKR